MGALFNDDAAFKVVRLSEDGMVDFCRAFVYLNPGAPLGPLAASLVDRMNANALGRVETCLPKDMAGRVLEDCRQHVDCVWTNAYRGETGRTHRQAGPVPEPMDLSWNPIAERWLLDTVTQYLAENDRRVCMVLDTGCIGHVGRADYPDIEQYYRDGTDEGYLFFGVDQVRKRFLSCLYYGFGMSFGCLVTLPEGLTAAELLRGKDAPLPRETAELIGNHADAVYIGSNDGLGYMVGWFGERECVFC